MKTPKLSYESKSFMRLANCLPRYLVKTRGVLLWRGRFKVFFKIFFRFFCVRGFDQLANWWAQKGLNLRPWLCKSPALPLSYAPKVSNHLNTNGLIRSNLHSWRRDLLCWICPNHWLRACLWCINFNA